MSTRLYSTVFAALLTAALAWGSCTACPLAVAAAAPQPSQQEDHNCCPKPQPQDDCTQPSGKSKQDCSRMSAGSQDYTHKSDTGIAPVLAALPAAVVETPATSAAPHRVQTRAVHSPADLFLRNAALLI